MTAPASPPVSAKNRYLVVAICFAAIVFDGYDLIIFGSTVPSLLEYDEWALSQAEVGALGSYALLGMLFGALASGPLTDRFGRRRVLLGCLILYSTATLGTARWRPVRSWSASCGSSPGWASAGWRRSRSPSS